MAICGAISSTIMEAKLMRRAPKASDPLLWSQTETASIFVDNKAAHRAIQHDPDPSIGL